MDVKYAPADIDEMVSKCTLPLMNNERSNFKRLLQKIEPLFDGTIGTWDTEPIDLELKDPDAKPYHAKPYPVPQSQEVELKAEIERSVSYGVLRKVNCSEWPSPMFTVTKKDQTKIQIYYRFERRKQKDPTQALSNPKDPRITT
jgi:hypothetical protein